MRCFIYKKDGTQVTVSGVRSIESRNGSILLRGADALLVDGSDTVPMYEIDLDLLDRIELGDD